MATRIFTFASQCLTEKPITLSVELSVDNFSQNDDNSRKGNNVHVNTSQT